MATPIANLSAVVTGAIAAARAVATETLPAAVTRHAVAEASRAWVAWLTSHLWAWLAAARAVAADNIPVGAAADAWGPCLQTAAKLSHDLYGWLAAAVVQKLPDVAAEKLLDDAAAWLVRGRGVAAYSTLALALLAVVFLGGAVCALTCRSMKGPGLGGARVPRAVFEANPQALLRHRANGAEGAAPRRWGWMQADSGRPSRRVRGLLGCKNALLMCLLRTYSVQSLRCKRAIKRSGASDLDLMMTVILYLTLST